ncbi:MAG: DNA recombination protein RmuC [Microgenomates group bacterium]
MNLIFFFTLIIALFIALIVIRLWLNKIEQHSKLSDELIEWLKSSTASVDQKLSESMKLFTTHLSQVQKSIGEFSQIGQSMQELQEFLTSPKLRGNIGEQVLKELLSQYFPKDCFQLQYSFKNGEKVDAVIKTSQGLIPIDSKFPMENFRRMMKEKDPKEKERAKKDFTSDVKKHIADISKKYIQTTQGTSDYALMYIPSESLYYEIINDEELFDFAGKMRVLPVSPMSFYAYMKAILMSYEGARIQAKAKEILEILQAIKKDYEKTEEALSILNKHLTNAYNQIAQVTKSFLQLGQKLTSTQFLSAQEKQKKLLE